MSRPTAIDGTYPLRTAARLTGLTPELLRAWERRYGVVVPKRTPGGTRRYTAADLERLRQLKSAVDAGHRIGQVAHLHPDELADWTQPTAGAAMGPLDEVLAALERLDGVETQRLLSLQLSALGPARFAREFAVRLLGEIGERWAAGELGIAPEHLATGVLRAMFGSALLPSAVSQRGPKIVFGTPTRESHELGLQMAALTALGAGANPIYLGPELPVEELVAATKRTDAAALALSLVTIEVSEASRSVRFAREQLPKRTHLWLGGSGAGKLDPIEGVQTIDTLEAFDARTRLLCIEETH
jgi:DNA-binding transcriptional MerR regulator